MQEAFAIIATSLVDKELMHSKKCKRPVEMWRTPCNIHETKNLSNILFFTIKMAKMTSSLTTSLKKKSLADQLICLEVPMKDKVMVMTLFNSLPPLLDHLITPLERHPMKELTFDFITTGLVHEVSKKKEKEPQRDDMAMLSCQP